jgi:hypothetical protein
MNYQKMRDCIKMGYYNLDIHQDFADQIQCDVIINSLKVGKATLDIIEGKAVILDVMAKPCVEGAECIIREAIMSHPFQ